MAKTTRRSPYSQIGAAGLCAIAISVSCDDTAPAPVVKHYSPTVEVTADWIMSEEGTGFGQILRADGEYVLALAVAPEGAGERAAMVIDATKGTVIRRWAFDESGFPESGAVRKNPDGTVSVALTGVGNSEVNVDGVGLRELRRTMVYVPNVLENSELAWVHHQDGLTWGYSVDILRGGYDGSLAALHRNGKGTYWGVGLVAAQSGVTGGTTFLVDDVPDQFVTLDGQYLGKSLVVSGPKIIANDAFTDTVWSFSATDAVPALLTQQMDSGSPYGSYLFSARVENLPAVLIGTTVEDSAAGKLELLLLDGRLILTVRGDRSGDFVGTGGCVLDLDDDGIDDLVVAAPGSGSAPGTVAIFLGPLSQDFRLSDASLRLTGEAGFGTRLVCTPSHVVTSSPANGQVFGFARDTLREALSGH